MALSPRGLRPKGQPRSLARLKSSTLSSTFQSIRPVLQALTFLPAAAIAPIGGWSHAKLYPSTSATAALRAVNAANAEQDIGFLGDKLDTGSLFLGSGGPFQTKVQYNQAGAGDLTPPSSDITGITPTVPAGSRPALWLGNDGPANVAFSASRPLVIPSSISFDRADCTIFLACRNPSSIIASAYFMFGDSASADFGLRSYSSGYTLQPIVDGANPTSSAPNNKTIGVAGNQLIVIHSNATRLRIYRDGEYTDFPPVSSKVLSKGGLVGSSFTGAARLDILAFEVFAGALSASDLSARQAAYKVKFRTGTQATILLSILATGDSIVFGTGGINNRTMPAELTLLVADTTIIRDTGQAGHFLGGPNLASGHYQDWQTASTRFTTAGAQNVLVANYGHNDIYQYIANKGLTAAQAVAEMQAATKLYCADARNLALFDLIIWQETLPDTSGGTSWTSVMEDARNQWNAWLSTSPVDANGVLLFNAIDKVATDSSFGLSNAETAAGRGMALTVNSSDGTHPNEIWAPARAAHLKATLDAAIPTPLVISATQTPSATATQGVTYPSFTVVARYGTAPYTYSLPAGWPSGAVVSTGGVVSGAVFQSAGVASGLKVRVTDAAGAVKDYTVPDITVAAAATLFLDTLTQKPDSAFAFRKLRGSYAGAGASLIRPSDSATSELGFSGEDPDLTNLNGTFGGTTGTINVQTWYDQIGSANFSEASNRPRVRNAGTNDTRTGTGTNPVARLAMLCASAIGMTGAVSASTTQAILVVASHNNNSNGQITAPSANGGLSLRFNADHTLSLIKQGTGVIATSATANAVTLTQVASIYVTLNPTTGAYAFFIDGVAAGSGTIAAQTFTAGLSTTLARATSENIHIVEAHFWSTIPGSGDQATIFSNPRAYYRTP